ncbi:MAG TPA: hypothetical protein PLX14_05390 [Anaerolineales bacterium]|nr:hypothetical protein [Anaerolineales bacterium]
MFIGAHKGYFWVTWKSQILSDLIAAFPEIVDGMYLVVSAFDSGPFVPTNTEQAQGWQYKNNLAFSPLVKNPVDLPTGEYDEWYVYPTASRPEVIEVFINYSLFNLSGAFAIPESAELAERFWSQLERLAPESYLAEGEQLHFVTRNRSLYKQVKNWEFPRRE